MLVEVLEGFGACMDIGQRGEWRAHSHARHLRRRVRHSPDVDRGTEELWEGRREKARGSCVDPGFR